MSGRLLLLSFVGLFRLYFFLQADISKRSIFIRYLNQVRVSERMQVDLIINTICVCRVKNVLTACAQCGEEDRLLSGLFENYLLVDFRDPRLESVSCFFAVLLCAR